MGYLVTSPRPASLTIGGEQFIENLVSFQVQDSSAFRNGLISTAGTLVLGTRGGQFLDDYDRNNIKRGKEVILQIRYGNDNEKIHPRGRLYVISSSYDPEQEQLIIELGCRLVLKNLLERGEDLLSLVPIPLDPAQQDYANVSASLAAGGKIAWVDRQNNIQVDDYFSGDTFGGVAPSTFTSVRGVTALQISPLALTNAIPDEVLLSYQYPVGALADDNQGKVETTETVSTYFARYPATTFERFPLDDLDDIITLPPVIIPPVIIPPTGCGNSPSPPPSNPVTPGGGSTTPTLSCNYGYETQQVATYVSATRKETRTTTYDGPAGQVSLAETIIKGPALEANSQYFADKYAYCTAVYANACQPNGGCDLEGLDEMILGRQETEYFYGSANEVERTVTSSYRPTLAAAQPTDWRSGNNGGVPQDFQDNLSLTAQYLHQVVIREFRKEDNVNIQETTTHTSSASRGSGIGANLDAYAGIKTSEVRRSSSTVTVDLRPDTVNAPTTATETAESKITIVGDIGGFVGDFGPYVVKEDVPVPLLLTTSAEIEAAVEHYGDYLTRFVKGDTRGLQIAEFLTEDISDNWTPNAAFRYYDPKADELMALRMDATTWGVDQSGCVLVTSAIWVYDLLGTVTIPSNIEGDSTPVIDGDEPADGGGDGGDIVVEEDGITNASFVFNVNLNFYVEVDFTPTGDTGIRTPPPQPETIRMQQTFVTWCSGVLSQPGALVTLDQDGSVPLSASGNIIVDDSLVVTLDLFFE